MRKLPHTPAGSVPPRRRSIRRILTGSIAAVAALAAHSAKAQSNHTWDGTIDLDWTVGGNWTGGVPDGNDNVMISAAAGGTLTNVYSGFASQYRLFFTTGAGIYNLTGPSTVTFFDFSGNAPKIENNSSSTQTISFGVAMDGSGSGNAAEINPTDGNLIFGSTVDLAGTTQLRIFGNNGNSVTFNGVLSSSGNGGANTIAINQNSNVVFAAANTYAGDTFVNAGKLQFAQGGSADSSTLRVGDTSGAAAAEVSITDADGGTTSASTINVRSGSSGAKTISGTNSSGTNTYSGSVSLDADATATSATAGGTLAFTGSTLDLKNQTLTVNGAGATTIGNALQNSSGTGKLTKSGTGTLTLSNATNSYSGATLVSNGVLEVSADGALGTTAGSITVSSGATLRLAGVNYATAEALDIAGVGFAGGALAATGASTYAGAITVSSNAKISSAGTLNLTGGVIKNGTTATFTGGGTISINGTGISGASANSDLVVDGATLVLNVANTYNGPTSIINSGILQLGASNVLPTSPATDLTVTSSTFDMQTFSDQIATLTLSTGTVSGSGTLTLGGDVTSSGTSIIAPAILLGASRTFTIGAGTTTASGNIGDVGFGITKADTGTLTVSGNNTYSGPTSIGAGIMQAGSATGLSPNSDVIFTAGTTRLILGGFSNTIGSITGSAGVVENANASPATLTIGNTNASGAYSSNLQDGTGGGALSVIKTGSGAQAITNGLFTGGLTINQGTWQLGGVNGLGNGPVIINGGAISSNSGTARTLVNALNTLAVNGSFTLSDTTNNGAVTLPGAVTLSLSPTITVPTGGSAILSGIISGPTFGITKDGAGTLTLSGANTYSGATGITQGILSVGTSGNLGDNSATNFLSIDGGTLRTTASLDLGVNRAITVGGSGATLSAATSTIATVSGVLNGSNTLNAAGGGVIVLSANNAGFSGNVTVNSQLGDVTNTTLRLSNASALTSGTVTVNGGVAAGGGNGNQVDLAGVSISGVGLVLNTVVGTNARSTLLGSTGTSTWSGGIQVNGDGLAGLNAGTGATLNIGGNVTDGGSFTGTVFVRGAGTGNMNGTINLPTGHLAKTDGGTWNLNTTGNTWLNTGISVGTLRTGIANALPSATAVTLGQNDANNVTLDLNGFSQTIGSLATNPVTGLAGTKTVTSAAAATLTINGTTNTTYAGVITGASLGLIKQGAGVQTLTGTNTFAGGTTIDAGGALRLGDQAANNLVLAAGTAVTNNGTLTFAPGTTNLVYNNPITGNGNITLDGLATATPAGITLSGANTAFTGSYTLNQGRMIFASQAAIGATTVPITVNGNATNGGQLWVNGAFSVANPLTLNGYGASETAGNLGAVRMAGGTLAGAITLGSNASINPENTTITISGNVSGPVGAQLLYGAPGTARNGSVTLTSAGGNTYAGGTLVRLGTGVLNANIANALGTGTARVESGTLALNVLNARGTAPLELAGGTVRLQAQDTTVTLGSNGLNATYYNFGTNITAANQPVTSNQFAGDLLYLTPRAFSRIDAQTNVPQAGTAGTLPIVPVPGFAIGAAGAGGVNDGILWKGLLNITNPGSYQFKGTNDDNLTVYIDGVQIGTIGVTSPLVNIGSAVTLAAGAHSIVIKQTQGGGGGYATVRYNGGVGSDAPTDELLGTDPGSITTGSLGAIDLGPLTSFGGTLDLLNDATTASLSLGNGTLNITSQTLSTLVAATGTITGATPTISVQNNGLTFTGAIGESSAGLGLTLSGPGLTEFQGVNAYTGTTTVTGGQLRLNQTGAGDSIAGNLTINAANANGDIANVRLMQGDQIVDTGLLTMTTGILDLGANNDTVGSIAMNGGRIIGGGTLTVTNLGASTLTGGTISSSLAGAGGLNKTGAGTTLALGAANTYTGVTTVSNGTLKLQGGSLGAGGAGNETSVGTGAQLFITNTGSGAETVNVDDNNGIRVAGGTATLGTLNFTGAAAAPVARVDAGGELILNTALTSAANIAKEGSGTLTFNYNVGATLPANVLHNAGALGFNGVQGFGAVAIPTGRAFRFNSDPGGAVDVTAPAGTVVIAGSAAADLLLPRINAASTGSLALGVNSGVALDLSADPTLSLGAVGLRTYSGSITPGASGYRLGGGAGELTVASTLTGANALTINQAGVVDLRGPQTFTGAIGIDGSGVLRAVNNHQLGTASNAVTLTNGGTLQLIGTVGDGSKVGALFHQVGNVLSTGARSITIGSGGGTIDTVSWNNLGSFQTLSGVNALNGSGTLNKTGFAELILLSSSNFSGNLLIAGNGGRVQLRSGGELPNVNSLTIGQSAEFLLHNNGALGSRQFPEASDADRLRDGAQINLNGGSFFFIGNDAVATNEQETVGTMVLGVGRNQIQINKGGGTATQGAQLNIANLSRTLGGGVLHIAGTLGTLGTPTGDHARINPLLLNGAALPASTANGTTLPWATTTNAGNFAGVSVTGLTGIADVPSTNQAAATGFIPVATTRYTFNGAANAAVVLAAGNQQMAGLRFVTNNAGLSLQFGGATDTLFLGDGVVIGDNNNQTRTIGSSTVRGQITAGLSAAAAGAKELFFHANQGTLAVESVVRDNNGAVTVHKGVGGGTLELRAANTYSGGTFVHQGRLNANVAGSLGSGPVTVKGAAIQLNVPGTNTGTGGFTIMDRSELYFQNGAAAYNTTGDRFTLVGEGNMLTGDNDTAGQGLNSVTRVSSITGGGQIIIPAGTHIRAQAAPNGVLDVNMPLNLGTNADVYFNLGGGGGLLQSITVGAGTPWAGLGSSVGTGWSQGTINANSDFTIQGLNRVGGNVVYALGSTGTVGGYTINNLAGGPINAFIDGQVTMSEDAPISLPSDLTFVVKPGGYLQPNVSNQFGAADIGLSRSSLLVQAGGTIDPGNFVAVGAAANQPVGMPYPIPSPMNAFATIEAGGRFLNNDPSGIGSTTGGATWTMQADSILQLGTPSAFLGSNAGLINAGQFIYEPGAIVRYETGRVYKHDAFINNESGGKRTVLEIFNGNRDITDAVNPFLTAAVGTALVVPMNLTFGDGGMITNDSADRTINERRGGFILEDGAVLAATSQTFLNLQENVTVPAGATLNIGSSRYVDGNPKNGLVQFIGPASNVFGAGAKLVVQDGSAFGFNGTHTFPDSTPIEIPAAVTNVAPAGAVGFNPGNGSTLLINTDNYMEIMGALTGNGAVIGNVGTPIFAPGYGATSDFTFAGGVRNANTRNPSMTKVGATKMTLTGFNDTQGRLGVMEGELSLAGPNGKWAGGEMNIGRGGILTFDNTVNAVADRQSNTGGASNRFLTTLGGGEFRVLGHATDVADVTMFGLGNSAGGNVTYGGNMGGFGKVTISPSGDLTALRTSVTFGQVENFQTSGERNSAWLLRGSGLGGLPGTYSSTGAYTPNAGNPKDGLAFITSPNFTAAGLFGQNGVATGFIHGAPGTPVVPTSGMLLGAINDMATEGDFVTIDVASGASRTGVRLLQASEYATSLATTANITTGLNVHATGALAATGDTRFQVIKLANGASLDVAGTLPNLTQAGQVTLNGGGILVPFGATATLNASNNGAGADSVIRTAGGVSAYVHSFGNLNVNGEFFSDLGLVKTGAGTATFAAGSLSNLRGRIALHEGTLSINDSLANVRAGAVSAVAFQGIHMELNGGTLNLNGNSQLFGRLESGNFLTTASTEGGTITSATPATITVVDAGGFSGHIAGAISYDKVGNNTHILHGTNPYTGTTTVRQGTLLLRADATLSNTTQVDLNYARIDIDDGHLAYVPDRINTAATINLRGADFVNRGRAGTLTQQHLGTVNMLAGTNLFQTLAGGGGATETYFNNFNRSLGTMASFQQNYGFTGTAGNDTTAIRYLINNISINGGAATTAAALTTLNNGILGGWAIANNDNFATYSATNGIGAMGNTEDGFANYNAGDLSTATATQNVNDGTARTIAASKTVNSFRYNAAGTITINAGQTLTLNTGGLLIVGGNDKLITGGSLTSNSGELNVWVNQNTTSIASQITGAIALTKGGNGALKLQGPGNNYSGVTYIGAGSSGVSNRSGELQLDVTGANGTTIVAIPGDLHIHQTQVTELQASQIAETANVFLYGGSILRLRDAASITETLRSINFLHAGGQDFNRPNLDRANAQATSTLRLTGPTPISSDNSNTVDIPGIHGQIGNLAFAGSNGSPQTLMVNSPVTVNGNAAAGLLIDPIITQVPTGVDDGGLVKAGTGMVVIRGVNTFGNPGVPTEVFNVQSGFVRADNNGPLGGVNAITTVQNGAVLLLNGNTGLTGSLQMKDGSTLSLTLASGTIGAVPSTGTLDVPSGATTTVGLLDYFVPSTNTGNVVVNHQLIGSGTINLTGIEYASGYNGGGIFQLRNEANSFSGAINIGTNAILEANTNGADLTGNTFGTATLNLNGGVLRIRDAGNNLAGAQTITYGNNVNLNADSMIDLDRLGTVATQKTVALGTLTIPSGTRTLSTLYGTAASITGNDYRVAFAQVDGAGTLVKGGSRFVDLNGYAAGFSGNITVAGPQDLNLPASGNLTLNAASNTINNLTVGGFHNFAAGKSVTINSTLDVTSNPGAVVNGLGGISTGSLTGAVTLNSTSTVGAAVVRNNGIIGADRSNSTLTAPSIRGNGLYQAYGADLTLAGVLADDGATPTTLKVAGTSTSTAVILTSTGSANTGGAEVQSGILRIAPTGGTATNPLGSGTIRVHGAAASTLGAGSQPISAQNAMLEFAGTVISQAGNITNTGTVRASSGTTTIVGSISGTVNISNNLAAFTAATVPGLLEGRMTTTLSLPDTNASGRDLTAARQPNPGNFGIRLEPRMAQTDLVTQNGLTGWSDNTTWTYTGYFYDADGIFTFMENVDDDTLVSIDGVTRLRNGGDRITSTATLRGQRAGTLDTGTLNAAAAGDLITAATPLANNPNLPAGWHTIEMRFDNGGGGAGPWVGSNNGFGNNYGFGLNADGTMALDGTQAFRPIDPGDGTLFRTAAGGKGNVIVEAGATLAVGGINLTLNTTLNGGAASGTAANLLITGAGASATDNLILAGATTPFGNVKISAGGTLTTGVLNVAANGTLGINNSTTGTLTVSTTQNLGAGSTTKVEGGTVNFNGAGTVAGTGDALVSNGIFNLNATGTNSLYGNLTVSGGTANLLQPAQIEDTRTVSVTGGTFAIGANSETVAGVLLNVGSITGSTGELMSTTDFDTRAGSASAILGGAVGLNKTTGGTVLLSGANTYSGTTSITAGILQIGDGGATGTLGSGAVVNSATLEFNRSNTYTVPNQISGAGNVIQSGAGTTTLTATNTFTGTTTISNGTLEAAGLASLGTTTGVAIATGGTLLLSGTGDQVANGAAFSMNGGTIRSTLNGLDEQFGTLTLTENSVIDFGGFALGNTFRFADSAALSALWTTGKTLSIWNWTPGVDHLYVGTNTSGLTGGIGGQLGKISFFSDNGSSLSNGFPGGAFNGTPFDGLNGEVSPVPEPSSIATVMGLLGLIGWRERRKARQARSAERRAIA